LVVVVVVVLEDVALLGLVARVAVAAQAAGSLLCFASFLRWKVRR
jgi:hypothetical protein